MGILLGVISSLIACFQLYVTMLNAHGEYLTRRNKLDFITSKYNSDLLFDLDLVVLFVDLAISIRTNLLKYERILEYETNTSYFFHSLAPN